MNNEAGSARDPELPTTDYFSKDDDIFLLSFCFIIGSNFEEMGRIMKRTPQELKLRFRYLMLIACERLALIPPPAIFSRNQRPAEERSELANYAAQNDDADQTSGITNHQ